MSVSYGDEAAWGGGGRWRLHEAMEEKFENTKEEMRKRKIEIRVDLFGGMTFDFAVT